MDEIIKIVFFLVIIGVGSLIKRMSEKREEEAQRKNAPRKMGAEELPEATRRMIYGTPDVPTARTARPASYSEDREGVNDEGAAGRPDAGKRDVLVMLEEMARQAQGRGTVTRTPTPVARPAPPRAAPQRAVPQQPARRAMMEPEQAPQMARPQMAQRPAQRPAPPAAARVAAAAPAPAQVAAKPAPKAPEPRRERKASAGSLAGLLRNMDDVRRGVILSEILGTPKGMM